MLETNPAQKWALSNEIQENFRSLPGSVCHDFFSRCSNKLLGNEEPDHERKPKETRRVHVSYEWEELTEDPPSGRTRRIRRKLSQVREEEADFSQSELSSSSVPMVLKNNRRGATPINTKSEFGCDDDLRLFLRAQLGRRGSDQNKRLTLYQAKSVGRKSRDSKEDKVKTHKSQPKCFELFCVHLTSLLSHRNQVSIEAERLAKRLADLSFANT